MTATITVGDPLLGDHVDDITTRIDELREDAPIHWWQARQAHLVLRYDEVRRLLHDPTMEGSIGAARRALVDGPRPSDHMMIRKDGDDHFRLRVLVQRAFTPRAVKEWGERASVITARLLDDVAERGQVDALVDYAWPLPVTVISTMLGVPSSDVPYLASLSTAAFDSLEPFLDERVRAELEARRDAFAHYVTELVADKRRHPADDLLTALLYAQDGDDRLSDDEVVQQTLLLYTAGHETTVNLVANGLAHLLRDDVQRRRLQHAPDLDTNIVEEVLRFDPPALFSERRAPPLVRSPARPSRRTTSSSSASGRRTTTRVAGARPLVCSTSSAPMPATTWRSAADRTTASAPHWRASRRRSPCRRSSGGSPRPSWWRNPSGFLG
ncbi:MAG: hypothetical protein QOD30_40 [Actinomycetota bacterium]|nr:hypothetical protein [Actinomycetota bacterium]